MIPFPKQVTFSVVAATKYSTTSLSKALSSTALMNSSSSLCSNGGIGGSSGTSRCGSGGISLATPSSSQVSVEKQKPIVTKVFFSSPLFEFLMKYAFHTLVHTYTILTHVPSYMYPSPQSPLAVLLVF